MKRTTTKIVNAGVQKAVNRSWAVIIETAKGKVRVYVDASSPVTALKRAFVLHWEQQNDMRKYRVINNVNVWSHG